jgi:hypothetical protein
MSMSLDYHFDRQFDAAFSEEYTLTDKQVLEIAKRFELGDDKTEILKFADAIQAAFMEENR